MRETLTSTTILTVRSEFFSLTFPANFGRSRFSKRWVFVSKPNGSTCHGHSELFELEAQTSQVLQILLIKSVEISAVATSTQHPSRSKYFIKCRYMGCRLELKTLDCCWSVCRAAHSIWNIFIKFWPVSAQYCCFGIFLGGICWSVDVMDRSFSWQCWIARSYVIQNVIFVLSFFCFSSVWVSGTRCASVCTGRCAFNIQCLVGGLSG